jgi:hypothetical protein
MKPQRKLQDQTAERVSLDSSGPGLGPRTSRLERERIWFLKFKKNPEEYQRIVIEFTPMISGYLLRLTKDEEAAKELTQETFVRAFSEV